MRGEIFISRRFFPSSSRETRMARRKRKAEGQRPGTLDEMLQKPRQADSGKDAAGEEPVPDEPQEEEQPAVPRDRRYLLAVIGLGDENLLRGFLESLPADVEKVLDTPGHVGSLEQNLRRSRRSRRSDWRHFVLFSAGSFDNLDLEYFATSPAALVMEIPDELAVKYRLKVQDTDMARGASFQFCRSGTISEAIDLYRKESSRDPRAILLESLSGVDFVWDDMTRKTWFGLGRREILPTYVTVGLETAHGEYLLSTEGAKGPYTGKLDKSTVQLLGR